MPNLVDEFTCEALAISIDRRLRSTDAIDMRADLFIPRGIPDHIRSDRSARSAVAAAKLALKLVPFLEAGHCSGEEVKSQSTFNEVCNAGVETRRWPRSLTAFCPQPWTGAEERMKRAASIINRAVSNGLTEVEVGRFPNSLFTDKGSAINQMEPGWEDTLTGLPRELHAFWKKYMQQRGYRLKFQIADWPNGMPGDISVTLVWG
jgi:hypothetical protein